jgi:hypothetical protein
MKTKSEKGGQGLVLPIKNSQIEKFLKKTENFKPTIFVRKVRKIILLMFWLG